MRLPRADLTGQVLVADLVRVGACTNEVPDCFDGLISLVHITEFSGKAFPVVKQVGLVTEFLLRIVACDPRKRNLGQGFSF
jgi:hypothetical protein